MELNSDHINEFAELDVVESLRTQGYNIDVLDSRVCPSSSSDEAYILQKIQTTETATPDDLLAEQIETWVCSCPSYLFQHSPVTSKGPENMGNATSCKHIRADVKAEKAKADKTQATL